jgi:hypothetical protein
MPQAPGAGFPDRLRAAGIPAAGAQSPKLGIARLATWAVGRKHGADRGPCVLYPTLQINEAND